jgi:hypothetical protein
MGCLKVESLREDGKLHALASKYGWQNVVSKQGLIMDPPDTRLTRSEVLQVNSICKAIRSPTDVIKPLLLQRDDLLHLRKQRAVFHME